MDNAYEIVKMFERRVAAHFGCDYGIAVDCCTTAIFLSVKYRQRERNGQDFNPLYAEIPRRTYISVPFALRRCGLIVRTEDYPWNGYYHIKPWGVVDAAKLWIDAKAATHNAQDLLWCVSFHYKKPIPIGRGGMILTSSKSAESWIKKARYDGRAGVPYPEEQITEPGWHSYMTPEQAARGLALMDTYPEGVRPRYDEDYPDLEKFRNAIDEAK